MGIDLFIPQTDENHRVLAGVVAFVGEHRSITVTKAGVTFHGLSGDEEANAIRATIQSLSLEGSQQWDSQPG